MFARCTTIQADPDMADQAIKMTEEQVVPMARQMEGFKGLLSFVNRDTGKGVTFTLWDTIEDREASIERANEIRSEVAQEMHGTVLSVEDFELVVDAR